MNVLCRVGLHSWEGDYINCPIRECRRCHRFEFKPKGYRHWYEGGEENTIVWARLFHSTQLRLEELRQLYRKGGIPMEEWREEADGLHEKLSEFLLRGEKNECV